MKTSKLGKVCFAAVLFAFGGLGLTSIHAQGDRTASAHLSVTIRTADKLAIEQTTNLDFGGVFLDKLNPSTVSMDKAGVVTSSNALLYDTDLQEMGGFKVMADVGFPYSLNFPTSLNLLLGGNVADNLVYTTAVYDPSGALVTPSTTVRRAMITTSDQFGVAGSVLVPADAKVGLYTANLDITIVWD